MPSWYERAAQCRRIAEKALQDPRGAKDAAIRLQPFASDEDPSVREVALRALAQVAPRARKPAIDIIMIAVDDEVDSVRVEAWRALAAAADPGCPMATSLALHEARSAEASIVVRTEALRALQQVAQPGAWPTVAQVAAHAKEEDVSFRCVAVQGLAVVSPAGDERVAAFLAGTEAASLHSCPSQEAAAALQPDPRGRGSARDPEWEVRAAALAALARLAPRECQPACDAAGTAGQDARWEVRAAAARALAVLAPAGDLEAACLLAEQCKDASFEVRRAALQALRVLERCEDEEASPHATAITACLECWERSYADPEVRALALETVVALLGPNAEEAVKFVAKGLEAKMPEARAAAVEGLGLVTGGPPSALLVGQIARRIIDDRAPVRKDAIMALRKAVPSGHPLAVEELAGHIDKPDSGVRRAVIEALRGFASRGDEVAALALATRLWDEEPSIRAAAVGAVAEVAPLNNDDYITRVCLCLEDGDKAVREAVAEALPQIADPLNRTAIQCLTHCVRNTMKYPKRENTREAACRALAKWAERGSEEAVYVLCGTICPEHPQATVAALRALPLVARPGDRAAIDGAAAALAHGEQRVRDVSAEVLEQLADRGNVAPASASNATVFEGRWTGGTIKGQKIVWEHGDVITPFEVRPGHILTTVCVDSKGRRYPAWARLDAYDRLRWDFGADWNRVLDQKAEAAPQGALLDEANARTLALERQIFGEPGGGEPQAPLPTKQESTSEAQQEQQGGKQDVGDIYAVAAVAAHFKSTDEVVRQAAIAALPRVVGKGNQAALDALLPMMTDEAVLVRFAAVDGLVAMAAKDDTRAVEALRIRLEDQERLTDKETGNPVGNTVGMNAAKALKRLVGSREELARIVSSLSFSGPSLRGF